MALNLIDRLLTVVVTATLTSAAWVVVGGSYVLPGRAAVQSGPTSLTSSPAQTAAAAPMGAAAVPATSSSLLIPVAGIRPDQLTDTFTAARAGGQRVHDAIDIMAPAGTAVLAAAPGTVEKLFLSKDGGNTIYLRSTDRRTIHYYAHLRDYAPGLKEGQTVEQGQRLGSVGSTGNANPAAPHLHFAILQTTPDAHWWEPTTAMNPYPLLRQAHSER
jgi:murein DD-endopeptidase MepM/ murein hydrolase activator NlpD